MREYINLSFTLNRMLSCNIAHTILVNVFYVRYNARFIQ